MCVTDNDMITSFSNPNYGLNNADALNSNLPGSQDTQFYDNDSSDDGLYATIDDLKDTPQSTNLIGKFAASGFGGNKS